jgi:hemolysin III
VRDEEWANGLSHAVGWLLSVLGTILLLEHVLARGSTATIASCLVYCLSLVGVYAASTLSHWVRAPKWRHWFRSWDQGLIYLLIAGTYTPIAVAYFDGAWHLITVLMWTLAIAGFISKVALRHRVDAITIWLYLTMGWLPILTLPQMLAVAPSGLLYLMLAGGIAYTVGSLLLMNDHRAPYLHTGWHLLVILGSALHFLVVWQYVVPTA